MDLEIRDQLANNLIEDNDSQIIHSDTSSPNKNSIKSLQIVQTRYDRNKFKGDFFWEFLGYFLLDSILGPLSYCLFMRFIKNGPMLARNLHIYGGKYEIFRIILWLMKLFCYISTFVFPVTNPDRNRISYNSISQFWILIYTDISLSVLYAAYYSSFTREEIKKFKTEVYDTGADVFDCLIALIRKDKTKILDKVSLTNAFPEIDPVNFFLVFPANQRAEIPASLETEPVRSAAPQLMRYGIVDGLVIRGERFATYILEVAGYRYFDIKVTGIKAISRLLVFIRVVLPLAINFWNVFYYDKPFKELGTFVPYALQQIFYSYLIFRFVVVYDILFLGLVMYYKKYNMLDRLWEIIKVKPTKHEEDNKNFRICTVVPQNAQTWLSVKRVLSSANEQTFVVIDTNMSFVLLYTFIFLAIYFVQGMDLLPNIFGSAQTFLDDNPAFVLLIALTVLVVIVVLVVDVVLGIFINDLFVMEQGEWILHKQVLTSISTKREIYFDHEFIKRLNPGQIHFKKLKEIYELLGANFDERFGDYLKRLKKSIGLTIDGVAADENNNPHTLLGIPTTVPVVVVVSALVSALGITTLSQVFSTLSHDLTNGL